MLELLKSHFDVTHLVATKSFISQNEEIAVKLDDRLQVVTERQLSAISSLKTNQSVLAVAKCLPNESLEINKNEYAIALDQIRDPGNLGTIIRIADWYGIYKLVCSLDCADLYHPKVIHSSMGSFTRVGIFYTDLHCFLEGFPDVYGAALMGDNVHTTKFGDGGILLIGNEARGISANLETVISKKVSIPRLGRAESLNAAIATAVICDNVFREF